MAGVNRKVCPWDVRDGVITSRVQLHPQEAFTATHQPSPITSSGAHWPYSAQHVTSFGQTLEQVQIQKHHLNQHYYFCQEDYVFPVSVSRITPKKIRLESHETWMEAIRTRIFILTFLNIARKGISPTVSVHFSQNNSRKIRAYLSGWYLWVSSKGDCWDLADVLVVKNAEKQRQIAEI